MRLKLAFYADDFTGATDTLSTLASAGQRAVLFLTVPTAHRLKAAGALDAIGIAGATRSMDRVQQAAELQAIAPYLVQSGAPVIHYKTCSTFDSSVDIGSIGHAVQIIRHHMDHEPFIPIVGGQPNLGRYCVFGNIFAAFQHGGSVFRLDRHPTMHVHPVTPMQEADLLRHLAQQGLTTTTCIQYPSYDDPDCADSSLLPSAQRPHNSNLDTLVDTAAHTYHDGVLFDVGCADHLRTIGHQIWRHALQRQVLAVGPSSVAQALISCWNTDARYSNTGHTTLLPNTAQDDAALQAPTVQPPHGSDLATRSGPVLVVSGSRSPLNSQQIKDAVSYCRIPVSVSDLLETPPTRRHQILQHIVERLQQGQHVLAYLDSTTTDMGANTPKPAQLAEATALLVADLLSRHRPGRLGLAGGDTSSHAIRALDVWGLSYIDQIDHGAALCHLHSDNPQLNGLEVMLKGGQMGGLNVFERLLH